MVQQFLPGALREFSDQLILLMLSGAGGAYARAVFMPEPDWRRRIAQGIAGAFSALCLGGMAALGINAVAETSPFSWLASGFIFGFAGEAGMRWGQQRILGKKND